MKIKLAPCYHQQTRTGKLQITKALLSYFVPTSTPPPSLKKSLGCQNRKMFANSEKVCQIAKTGDKFKNEHTNSLKPPNFAPYPLNFKIQNCNDENKNKKIETKKINYKNYHVCIVKLMLEKQKNNAPP